MLLALPKVSFWEWFLVSKQSLQFASFTIIFSFFFCHFSFFGFPNDIQAMCLFMILYPSIVFSMLKVHLFFSTVNLILFYFVTGAFLG